MLYSQVTVVTSQPGRSVVRQLETGLKDADLVSLKRLLVVQIYNAVEWGQDNPSPEATHSESEGGKLKYTHTHTRLVHKVDARLVKIHTVIIHMTVSKQTSEEH